MDTEEKRALAEHAYRKAVQYELDYGCCPQCVLAAIQETVGIIDDNTIKASHGLSGGGGEVERRDHPGDARDVEAEVRAQHHQCHGDHGRIQGVQRRAQAQAGDGQCGPGLVAHGNSLAYGRCPARLRTLTAPMEKRWPEVYPGQRFSASRS